MGKKLLKREPSFKCVHPENEGHVVFWLKAEDDFCPNFAGDEVEMHVIYMASWDGKPEEWRVAVWGADDLGFERDGFKTREEALLFAMTVPTKGITFEKLKEMGFHQA